MMRSANKIFANTYLQASHFKGYVFNHVKYRDLIFDPVDSYLKMLSEISKEFGPARGWVKMATFLSSLQPIKICTFLRGYLITYLVTVRKL